MPAQYSAPPTWGQSKYHDLELPSGHTIQVQKVDLQALVAAELVDEFDKLSSTADEKVVQPAKGKRPADRPKKKQTKAEKDAAEQEAFKKFFTKDNIESLTGIMDRLLPQLVVQPKIKQATIKDEAGKWVPLGIEDREEGVIYVDTVPFADQMAIFEFGMSGMDMDGLESFREQPEQAVANVAPEPDAPNSP